MKQPAVEWKCSECNVGGSVRYSSTGSARTMLSHIAHLHREESPQCSALNVAIYVPYEVLDKAEIKRWEIQEETKRKQLLAKGVEARRKARFMYGNQTPPQQGRKES